jgi:RimJ/RimL family protein N-acetyltransferase
MILIIKEMDRKSAEEISRWKYEVPYSIYSMDGSEECVEELLDGSFYLVKNEDDNIVGFYCFKEAAKVPAGNLYRAYEDKNFIDIGLGMNPELCGKGHGFKFVASEVKFAKALFGTEKFRLTVAEFNERAIKLYEKAGFKKVMEFNRTNEQGTMRFNVMELS